MTLTPEMIDEAGRKILQFSNKIADQLGLKEESKPELYVGIMRIYLEAMAEQQARR